MKVLQFNMRSAKQPADLPDDQFGDRVAKIRHSLTKISQLMAEMKAMDTDNGEQ